jgi:hypothetical protein
MREESAMSDRSDGNSRVLSRRLAELLSGEAGAEILMTMQLLRQPFLPQGQEGDASPASIPVGPSPRIGNWRLDPEGERYCREAKEKDSWGFWANREGFALKKSGHRTVLLGESAARAYLYDPAISLADLLGEYLAAADRPGEVIDLARTDINAFQITDLLREASSLDPDCVVFFAGNNWLYFNECNRGEEQEILDGFDRGFDFTRELFESRILPRIADRVLGELDRCFPRARKIVVIPEFNLAGWRSDPESAFPIADYGDPSRLLDTWPQLTEAAQREDWAAVLGHCDAIEAQTGKKSYLPFYFRGQALLALGRPREAIPCLELARDAIVGIQIQATPRCPRPIQEGLRAAARRLGMTTVDLPALFRGAAGEHVPGYDYFLDYCHLSLRGLHALARAATEAIAGGAVADRYRDEADVGSAYLLAAIHNAHFGQSKRVVREQLEKCVALDPDLRPLLRCYLRFQSSGAPRWLHRSFVEAAGNRMVEKYFCLGRPDWWDKFADYQIFEAVLSVLGEPGLEAEYREAIAAHLPGPVTSLLDDRFRSETFRQFHFDRAKAFFEAHRPTSLFFLPLAEPQALPLRVCARLPAGNRLDGPAELGIEINGTLAGRLPLTDRWQTFSLTLGEAATRPGVNTIRLVWPRSFPPWRDFAQAYRRSLRLQVWPSVLPVFGEVFSLEIDRRASSSS